MWNGKWNGTKNRVSSLSLYESQVYEYNKFIKGHFDIMNDQNIITQTRPKYYNLNNK